MFIKYSYLIILICIKFSFAISQNQDQFVVKKIVFQGLDRVLEEHMLINLPIQVGQIATSEKISAVIRNLFATNLFKNIKILKNNNTLIIQVEECAIIKDIVFSGNFTLNKSVLKSLLQDSNIQIGYPLYPASVFQIEKALKNFYEFLGKENTKIDIHTYFLPKNLVTLNINILESKNVFVKKIDIIGNKKFNKKQLIKNIELCEQNFISNLLKTCIYKKNQILQAQKDLHYFYLNQGYIDFNIRSIETNITEDYKFADITFNIYEGDIFKISKIFFLENTITNSKKVNVFTQSIINKTYNEHNIIKLKNLIKNFLEIHGYNHPKIFLEIQKNYSDLTVQIFIHIDLGKQLYVHRIYFTGYESTREIVFRRELTQLEGDLLNISNVKQDIKKINNLKYAEVVGIKIEDSINIPNHVNIYYHIKEHAIGKINFGMGFGIRNGIQFHLGIQKDNLFDNGSFLQMYSEKNPYQTYLELFLLSPYLKTNGLHTKSKIFFKNTNTYKKYAKEINLHSYGANFFIALPEYKNKLLDFGLEYIHNYTLQTKSTINTWNNLHNAIQYKYVNSNKNQEIYSTKNDIFFIIHWNYNTVNTDYFPNSGINNKINGKITLPWSNNKYYQIFLNSKYFIPVSNNNHMTWMIGTYLGYTNGLKNKQVPFYDKFYTGGFETIRGFYHNTVGPKIINYNCNAELQCFNNSDINSNIFGGNAVAITNIELIFPISFLTKKYYDVMRISFFLDSGTTWETNSKNTIFTKDNINYHISNKIRVSSGIFLKWLSPFGPVSLSYAIPIQKHTHDHIESIQFNIGKLW